MTQLSLPLQYKKPLNGIPLYESSRYKNLYDLQGLGIKVVREKPRLENRVEVSKPSDLEPVLEELYRGVEKECFYSFLLNSRNELQGIDLVSVGCLNSSLIHPRELFRLPIILASASLICCHNHPSGSVEPSAEDRELTKRLYSASEILGIELLDHLIWGGDGRYLSMKEASLF